MTVPEEARAQIRAALLARSQPRLEALLVELTLRHRLQPVREAAVAECATLPEEDFRWWNEPCGPHS